MFIVLKDDFGGVCFFYLMINITFFFNLMVNNT